MQLRRGPLFMIAASASFTSMVACVRLVRADLSGVEIVMWRAAISLPLLLMVLRGGSLRLHGRWAFWVRAVLGFAAMACFYTAALHTTLVTLNLLTRLQPILIAIFAPLVLGQEERGDRRVWLAAAGGIAGTALLVVPDLRSGVTGSLWAVVATFFAAGAHIALRRAATEDRGPVIVFWFHASMLLLAGIGTGSTVGIDLPDRQWWWILGGVGLFATAGQLLMTKAYSLERAPVVAMASYTGIFWALLLDWFVFGELPTAWALGGGALVLGSSLWLVLGRDPGVGPGLVSAPSRDSTTRAGRGPRPG